MCGANMSVISYIIKREGNPKYWYMLFQALDENKKELGYQEVEFIPEENKAFLIHLHVNWRHRHNGIAKQLLDETFRVLVEDMKIPIIENHYTLPMVRSILSHVWRYIEINTHKLP